MMYKCADCGYMFDEGITYTEDYGEQKEGCPRCGGYFEETVRCDECGEQFLEEELTSGLCEECAEKLKNKYRYDFSKCFKISQEERESVELNSFLCSQFTAEEIERILLRELMIASSVCPVDCSDFIENDELWFLEKAIEGVKE